MRTRSDKAEHPGAAGQLAIGSLPSSTPTAIIPPSTARRIAAPGLARPTEHRRLPRRLDRVSVVVLFSQSEPLQRGRPIDILADEETARVASIVGRSLIPHAHEVLLVPVRDDLEQILKNLDPRSHLIFNLCESLGGRSSSEAEAAHIIHKRGFVYTGADPQVLKTTQDKIKTKRLLMQQGIPTPSFRVVHRLNDKKIHVTLPAIVKPSAESGSLGITQRSLAHDLGQLHTIAAECLDAYRQPVLIETYIPGREINVAIWGAEQPEILPLYEIDFRWTSDPLQRIVSFESKWVADSVEYSGTPGICPAHLKASEARSIRKVALQVYRLLGLRSYARIDMRFFEGVPYVLDVNANPDLAPNAGFYLTAKAAGYSYSAMVSKIAQLALDAQR